METVLWPIQQQSLSQLAPAGIWLPYLQGDIRISTPLPRSAEPQRCLLLTGRKVQTPQGHGVLPAGQGMELEAGRLCHWVMCIPTEDFSMLSSGRSCAFRYSAFEGKPLILFPGKSPWQRLLLLHPHNGCFAEHCLPPTPLQDSRVRPERSPPVPTAWRWQSTQGWHQLWPLENFTTH